MKNETASKALIYDDNCPLCKAYTSAFVKSGLLAQKNRVAFTEVNMQEYRIDWQRAKHEIPLIDIETGHVWYGVEALTEILKQRFPFIMILMRLYFLNWFFHQLYKLISYNRKIIIAHGSENKIGFDCTPDYSYTWRWILFITATIFSFILLKEANLLPASFASRDVIKNISVVLCVLLILLLAITGRKITTELFAHASLTLLITSFLLLVTIFLKKNFLLEAWSYHVLLTFALLISAYQLYKRIYYIVKTRYAET